MTRIRTIHFGVRFVSERGLFERQQIVKLILLKLIVKLSLLLDRLILVPVRREVKVATTKIVPIVVGIVLQKRIEVILESQLQLVLAVRVRERFVLPIQVLIRFRHLLVAIRAKTVVFIAAVVRLG